MGIHAMQWWHRQPRRALNPALISIMWEACYSAIDETAALNFGRGWLKDRTRLSWRSLERYLPELEKLEWLVESDVGFRLSRFYADTRQVSATTSANLAGANKEGSLRIDDLKMEGAPPIFQSQEFAERRRYGRRGPSKSERQTEACARFVASSARRDQDPEH